jgi:hypothetical protein
MTSTATDPELLLPLRADLLRVHQLHLYSHEACHLVEYFKWYCDNKLEAHIQLCTKNKELYNKVMHCLTLESKSTQQMEMVNNIIFHIEVLTGLSYSALRCMAQRFTEEESESLRANLLRVHQLHLYSHEGCHLVEYFHWYDDNKLEAHIQLCIKNKGLYNKVMYCQTLEYKSPQQLEMVDNIIFHIETLTELSYSALRCMAQRFTEEESD